MVTSAVGKLAGYGLLGGVVTTAVVKPKTQTGEHFQNKVGTAATLGALAVTPSLIKSAARLNPKVTEKVALKTGKFTEKAIAYIDKNALKLIDKVKSTKVGSKLLNGLKNVAKSAAKKLGNFLKTRPNLRKAIGNGLKSVLDGIEKFAKAPTAKKGKYALIAGGVALLTYTALKTVTNYYKKEGAIDQKYAYIKA